MVLLLPYKTNENIMKIRFLILLMLSSLLFGCGDEYIKSTQEQYTIVAIDPPKRFYVDIVDSNGNVFKRVGYKKRCYNWKNIPLNSVWNFKTDYYKKENGDIVKRPNSYDISSKLC